MTCIRSLGHFDSLAGVRGLFPSLSDSFFLRNIFDQRMESAFLVKGHHYEDLAGKEQLFHSLETAIVELRLISFDYSKEQEFKAYSDVEPYKLLNHKGIWYLAGKDAGKLKTFSFSRIQQLRISNASFTPDPEVQETLLNEDGIWFGPDKKEIMKRVRHELLSYSYAGGNRTVRSSCACILFDEQSYPSGYTGV